VSLWLVLGFVGTVGATFWTFPSLRRGWWAVATLTTVGYGDHFPVTAPGRFIAVLLMIGGICLIGVATATVAHWIITEVAKADNAHQAATVAHVEELRAEIRALQQQMAERANLSEEANRQNMLQRAKFFAELGSTPGNTLVAGLIALKKNIPDIIQNDKDQKLARQQADKAIYDLEESMRMEKLGVYDKADVKKQSAIKTMADLQSNLTTASVQQASSEKRLQADLAQSAATLAASTARDATDIKQAEIMERSARTVAEIKAISEAAQTRQMAAQRAESAAVAADQKLFTQHAAAQQELSRAMERAERLRSGKDYQASLAVIQQATMGVPLKPDGTVDESKINSVLKANYDRAKANIERADTEMFNIVKAADETAKMAFNRLNIPGGAGAPPANNIKATVEAGGQKYEPDKYDYKIAEDGSVQRKSKGK
jgi:hypothetical protein